MEPVLELRDVHKRFGTTAAVDGVSLSVQHGEVFTLLGPSGCGKSTTLRIVAGLEEPDNGEVLLDARLIASPGAPTSQSAATTPPATASVASTAWDQLVAAAQKEGKLVVSGPPAPDARTRLPDAFKQRFNIEMEYLAGNSSQLASRIETERAANQYTIDVSVGGPDTVYGTFLANRWLDPLKPVLMLPDVIDPKVWPTGAPWFRDPTAEFSLQIFNTVNVIGYINTSLVSPDEIKTTDDLLNSKFKGKLLHTIRA